MSADSMKNISFHHLVFTTKYSRKKYKNHPPIILDDSERQLVFEHFLACSIEMKFKILSLTVLPDHVHSLIALHNSPIEKIIQKIKGGSAYKINIGRGREKNGNSKHSSIWAESYFNKVLESESSIFNAIEYISNQYTKHYQTWGEIKQFQIILNKADGIDEFLDSVLLAITPDLSRGL